ncbi:MAG: bifunctional 5,10-methylenetetrahydrofolate dehydrogenase/5,10-methenyltetrahydrofolate cyclohydrolase [Actinomycetota bacterium]
MSRVLQRTPGGAVLLDGLRLRDESLANIKATIAAAGGPKICLATVLIGDDPPSHIYVNSKHKKAQEVGMVSRGVNLPETATQAQVEDAVAKLVADDSVHGILVQLPLPKHIDTEAVLKLLPAEKDVDGLTEKSLGRLVRGIKGHVPCTPLGVFRLLQRYEIETRGKRVVVIGRSSLVGLPQMLLLVGRGADATVTVAHKSTHDIIEVCRESDIIIAAAGSARMVTATHVKAGATVIDVGVTRINNKIVGDVDFEAVQSIAGAITPMPGGTGPMTIASLLENTLEAARMLKAI